MIPYFTWSRAEPFTAGADVKPNQVGLFLATTGNLTVVDYSGGSVTYNTVATGPHPMKIKQVTSAPANTLVLYE